MSGMEVGSRCQGQKLTHGTINAQGKSSANESSRRPAGTGSVTQRMANATPVIHSWLQKNRNIDIQKIKLYVFFSWIRFNSIFNFLFFLCAVTPSLLLLSAQFRPCIHTGTCFSTFDASIHRFIRAPASAGAYLHPQMEHISRE